MTKPTLDELMGVVYSEGEYERYFAGFKDAQEKRVAKTELELLKKQANWSGLYRQFLTANYASDINAVMEFKESIKKCIEDGGGEKLLPPPPYSARR